MKTVLVTGANGFVGNHLVRELAEHGYRVIGVGGPQGSDKSPHIDEYVVVDLQDPRAVAQLGFTHVDAVVHLAGLAAVGPSFDEPLNYLIANMGMQVNLFETARKQQAQPKFLIISSGTLYDPTAAVPLVETSPVVPNSPYAVSKLGQEQLAGYYGSRGFDCVVARPFNHIGPGQGLGFIVPDFTKQVVEVEKGISKRVLVGNLDAKRDYTDVRDIVRAYRLLVEKGRPGETYNICSGKARSGHEILDGILKTAGAQVNVEQDPDRMRPSDTPIVYGSHDKLTKDTGWQSEIPLEKTLADVVADWRERL